MLSMMLASVPCASPAMCNELTERPSDGLGVEGPWGPLGVAPGGEVAFCCRAALMLAELQPTQPSCVSAVSANVPDGSRKCGRWLWVAFSEFEYSASL